MHAGAKGTPRKAAKKVKAEPPAAAEPTGRSTKSAPRKAAARKLAEAAAEPAQLQPSGKLTMRKRRVASVGGRSMRSKPNSNSNAMEARGIGLDVPYEWGNPAEAGK